MNRLIAIACLAAQLALWPEYGEEEHAQPVFFSLLFPQLMPRQQEPVPEGWFFDLLEGAREAVLL